MSEKGLAFEDDASAEPPRRPVSKGGIIAAFFSFLFLGTLFHPVSRSYHPACHAYSRLRPLAIEERVHKVLASTPLIGMLPSNRRSTL